MKTKTKSKTKAEITESNNTSIMDEFLYHAIQKDLILYRLLPINTKNPIPPKDNVETMAFTPYISFEYADEIDMDYTALCNPQLDIIKPVEINSDKIKSIDDLPKENYYFQNTQCERPVFDAYRYISDIKKYVWDKKLFDGDASNTLDFAVEFEKALFKFMKTIPEITVTHVASEITTTVEDYIQEQYNKTAAGRYSKIFESQGITIARILEIVDKSRMYVSPQDDKQYLLTDEERRIQILARDFLSEYRDELLYQLSEEWCWGHDAQRKQFFTEGLCSPKIVLESPLMPEWLKVTNPIPDCSINVHEFSDIERMALGYALKCTLNGHEYGYPECYGYVEMQYLIPPYDVHLAFMDLFRSKLVTISDVIPPMNGMNFTRNWGWIANMETIHYIEKCYKKAKKKGIKLID